MVETFESLLWLKVIQAVLERILDVPALVVDLIVSFRLVNVAIQQRHHVIHHLLIARKDDVRAARIVGEALFLDREAMPPAAMLFLKNFALLLQMGRDADAG